MQEKLMSQADQTETAVEAKPITQERALLLIRESEQLD